jgi:CTP:molybdopterin cytidylyltransferase MocA
MAVVLAGRRNEGRLRAVSSEPWEALIEVGGRPMAARVVEAVRGAVPGRVAVVGPQELLPYLPEGVTLVAPGATLIENLERGLAALDDDGPVLVATGDIPLLRAEHVTAFLQGGEDGEPGDVGYSIVPREAVEAVLPGVHRTYVRLAEGIFTGGNLLSLRRSALPRLKTLAQEVVAFRKAPWRLAGILGPVFLARFLFGRVRLAEAEERFSRLGRFRGRAVIVPHAEVGIDVDKPSDLAFCESYLARGPGGDA